MHLGAGTQAATAGQQHLATGVGAADAGTGVPSPAAAIAQGAETPDAANGPEADGGGFAGTFTTATNEPLTWNAFASYSLKQLRSIMDEMPEALQEAEVLAKASAAAAANAATLEQQPQQPSPSPAAGDDVLGSSAEPPAPSAAADHASTAMEDGELQQDTLHESGAPDVPAPPLPTSDSAPGIDAPHSRTSGSAAIAKQASAQPSAAAAAPASATSVSAVPEPDPPPSPPAADPPAAVATGFTAGRPARLDPSPGSSIAAGPLPPMPGWPPMGAYPPFMPAFHFPPAAPWPPPPMFFFPPPGGGFPGVPAPYAQPALSVAVSPTEPAPMPDADDAPPPLPDEPATAPALPPEPGALAPLSVVASAVVQHSISRPVALPPAGTV